MPQHRTKVLIEFFTLRHWTTRHQNTPGQMSMPFCTRSATLNHQPPLGELAGLRSIREGGAGVSRTTGTTNVIGGEGALIHPEFGAQTLTRQHSLETLGGKTPVDVITVCARRAPTNSPINPCLGASNRRFGQRKAGPPRTPRGSE